MSSLHRVDGRTVCLATLTNYYLLGATQDEVAFFLGVAVETLKEWLTSDPIIASAAHRGAVMADANVAAALYKCAVGYKARTAKVVLVMNEPRVIEYDQYYAPDVNACKTWLSQRRPETWAPKIAAGNAQASEAERESKSDGIRKELESRIARLTATATAGGLAERAVEGRA
jgi:hypothetical protein